MALTEGGLSLNKGFTPGHEYNPPTPPRVRMIAAGITNRSGARMSNS